MRLHYNEPVPVSTRFLLQRRKIRPRDISGVVGRRICVQAGAPERIAHSFARAYVSSLLVRPATWAQGASPNCRIFSVSTSPTPEIKISPRPGDCKLSYCARIIPEPANNLRALRSRRIIAASGDEERVQALFADINVNVPMQRRVGGRVSRQFFAGQTGPAYYRASQKSDSTTL